MRVDAGRRPGAEPPVAVEAADGCAMLPDEDVPLVLEAVEEVKVEAVDEPDTGVAWGPAEGSDAGAAEGDARTNGRAEGVLDVVEAGAVVVGVLDVLADAGEL